MIPLRLNITGGSASGQTVTVTVPFDHTQGGTTPGLQDLFFVFGAAGGTNGVTLDLSDPFDAGWR